MTKEDLGCAISGLTYGWELSDKDAAIKFLTRMSYAADGDAADTILQSFRTLKPGQYEAVVYSPLERTKIEPDIILMYLNPAQLMRCLHGSTHHSGQPITCSFSGRAASCTEGVIGAFLDQTPKVIVPAMEIVWATVQDHEMAYALPASHLKDLVVDLPGPMRKEFVNPIPAFLRYQPK